MLHKFWHDGMGTQFAPRDRARQDQSNLFSIIVGKNGTGKSRLLRSVVCSLLRDNVDPDLFSREDRVELRRGGSFSQFDATFPPSRIICVATNPFDKFPLLRRDNYHGLYSYLGLRGLPSNNMGLAYMSRVVCSLLESVERRPRQGNAIARVLKYLGYDGVFEAVFSVFRDRRVQDILFSASPMRALMESARPVFPNFIQDNIAQLRQILLTDEERFHHIIDVARSVYPEIKHSKTVKVYIDRGGLGVKIDDVRMRTGDLLLLAQSGLLRLRDVRLSKSDGRDFSLQDASSGEQSVVMGLLGIAGQIQDGSLICIDEPEVCLHPEWQEKYIELLVRTFESYSKCHFILATHSPQIVAEMPLGNCYVTSMEEGVAHAATDYAHRSIDFQLANLFQAPGHRNEYLNRIALNAFAKISREKRVDSSLKNDLAVLGRLASGLRDDDPLRDLIAAINEAVKIYG